MLNLLIDYAKSHGLTIEPGFKPKTIRWVIVCDQAGSFLNIQELDSLDDKKNRGRTFEICPDLSQPEMKAGGAGCRHFLVDTIEVVTLLGKDGDVSGDPKKKAKHDFFVSLLRQATSAMQDLDAVVELLESTETLVRIQQAFSGERFKPTDNITFAIVGRTPMYLAEDDAWHDWWRRFRQSLLTKKSTKKRKSSKGSSEQLSMDESMRCLGSGELIHPAPTHFKIEGLGSPMQDLLISFKQESFQSYFLQQSKNAAVSEEMAAAYRAGLNDIIYKHSQNLAGARIIHWYAGETKVEKQEDPMLLLDDSLDLSWLDDAGEEKDKERDALYRGRYLLSALKSGTKPRLNELEKYRYYAMILSTNSGRVVTRDWIEGQFGKLAESIVAWYEDLEITNISGDRSTRSPKIERVITCLLPVMKTGQEYGDWIKPVGGERAQLWHAAVSREVSLPHKVLTRLIPLHQAFMLSGDYEKAFDEHSSDRARNLSLLYTRMGLLKAYHIRKGDKDMKPYLNEEHPNPAYHCGRLMAVYADLQRAALRDVGAGVIQRYYAAASATPALILGRLSRGSQFHLNKLEGGLAHWYEQRIASIWGCFEKDPPTSLTLEEQSLFALGYYQQIAAPRKSSKNPSENNNESKGE